jgi:hypothetical protein
MTGPGAHPADLAPGLWTLQRSRGGRHRVIRAIAAVAVGTFTSPGQTVIVASPDRALGRVVLGEITRAGRHPILATAAAGPGCAIATPGRGALLLVFPSHRHPGLAFDSTGSPLLVADEWVRWLRQTLLGGRRLLRPGAPVVTVTRPTRGVAAVDPAPTHRRGGSIAAAPGPRGGGAQLPGRAVRPGCRSRGGRRHHGQLLDLPGAVITAGRAAGLLPTQRCAAVTVSARGTPIPLRPGWAERLHGAGQQQRLTGRTRESGAGRVRWLTGYPVSRVAHHDIVVFHTPPTLTETAALANAHPPVQPEGIPGIPFRHPALERPAA